MPSSVRFGSRPSMPTIRWYSSGVNWCAWTTSGVTWLMILLRCRTGGNERTEDRQAIRGSHQRLGCALGMRHHSQDVAPGTQHAGDVTHRTVRVLDVPE